MKGLRESMSLRMPTVKTTGSAAWAWGTAAAGTATIVAAATVAISLRITSSPS